MKRKINSGCLCLNIDNTGVARNFIHGKGYIRTDSLIVGDVKYSLTDALLSGTILPFSSKQIKLVLTLDLLFGRSGLSFSQNKPGEHLEQTHAASKQKSLTDSLFRAVTLFR